jgi:hypothetical protein
MQLKIFIPLCLILFGCSMFQVKSKGLNDESFPDYDKPESQFAMLEVMTMATGYLDDYINEYIVFEGYYSGIFQDPHLLYNGRKRTATDMQSVYVRNQKHGKKNVRVVYPDSHELDVRHLTQLNRLRSRLKVFAYVLPPGKLVFLKNGKPFRSFDETLIWLIHVDVVFDDGIHL